MGFFPSPENFTLIIEGLSIIVALYSLLYFFNKTTKTLATAPEASGGWPITGHLNLLTGSTTDLPHLTLSSMADRCGPIFTIRLGIHRVMVVSSCEIVREIFTAHDLIVSNRPKYLAAKILGHNYASFSFSPHGPYWVGIRKMIAKELMCASRLEKIKSVRVSELENSIRKIVNLWREKKQSGKVLVEMKRWFWELNMNIALRTIAGRRYNGDEEEMKKERELMREWFHYTGMFVVGDALPMLRWLDLGGHEKKMKEVASRLDLMVSKWLEEHRKKNVYGNGDSETETDFIDVMLSVIEADDRSLVGYNPDTIIKSTCMTLIVSSADTTTVMLTWALSLLLNNRHALAKVQQELETHVGNDRQVNESDIKNLVYLDAVLKEALRLYPAAFLGGPRAFSEDCTISGYHVPKGTWLLVNMWKLHRDLNIWSDPCEFKPERFLTAKHKHVDVKGVDFELIPFGAGRRMCPGIRLGLQMLHMVLATLIQNFEMSTLDDAPVDMTASAGMTNAKASPLEVVMSPRFRGEVDG